MALSREEQEKTLRLVDYLLRLASLRTKVVRTVSDYEAVLWLSQVPQKPSCFTPAWGRDGEYESDVWIEIQTRPEPQLPPVPDQCKDWIDIALLRKKGERPGLRTEITRQIKNQEWHEGCDQPEYILKVEKVEHFPQVQKAWERYLEKHWVPWVEDHNEWEAVHKVYSKLFTIHQNQLRLGEEYELVFGLGLLTWKAPAGQSVSRHLLVADATLEFEARLSKFTVRAHPEGAKLRPELDMLDIEDRPPRAEESLKTSLTSAHDDPWKKYCIEDSLKALVHSLSSRGEYKDSLERTSIQASERPVVEYAPALILRKRSAKGLSEALKRIREQIETGKGIPDGFADLAEIPPGTTTNQDSAEAGSAPFDGEVFFPKPCNAEQRRIVDRLRAADGVLVQGPPGTGKSHTIANLICHFLATGQRALITAKTPRALGVLEGLIPKELRPVCINLLGSGLDEQRALESSVGGILRRRERWNQDQAERECSDLDERLRRLREEKTAVDRRLRQIRESETAGHSIAEGAYRGTAARIAEAVNRDRPTYEWFSDKVPWDKPCQVSATHLNNLLANLRHFTPERRRELSLAVANGLPPAENLENLVRDEARAAEEARSWSSTADEPATAALATCDPETLKAIRDALFSFRETKNKLTASTHSWMSDALSDILAGNSALWHELYQITLEAISSIEGLVELADDAPIEFPDSLDARRLLADIHTLQQHVESGGKLGWGPFRPRLVRERVYVLKSVRVGGRTCSTAEDFANLAAALRVRIQCDKVWASWAARTEETGQGPYRLQLAALKSLCDSLEDALSLEHVIDKCRDAIRKCSALSEPIWPNPSEVDQLAASCCLALSRSRLQRAADEIQAIEESLSCKPGDTPLHPATKNLLQAVRNRNVREFKQSAKTVEVLTRDRLRLREMEESLSVLRRILPRLTEHVQHTCNEPYWDDRTQHIHRAWQWAQARYWVEEYVREEDLPALTQRAKQIENDLGVTIATLASRHAWSFCFSRLKEDHRRHMEAWQQSMRQLGKGTGKHALRHRREAQRHLNQCKEAVPAWVMPLHRVWDTISPAPGIFDVIIVDEASQCGFEALPLCYLGKKILIVGDDKQISPDVVGLPRDAVHHLMEKFLHDFSHGSSFHIERSLFDHGKLRYGTRITLREHFRCMPEIIRFSNELCYSDTPLVPLRQYRRDRLPPLEHVFVERGYREGSPSRAINPPEAEAIVDRIVQLCQDPRYDKKSFGVIVLQGEAQGALIENLLLERLGAEEMERRRLVCGNPYSFQGDERDVTFLSLVAASNKPIGPLAKASDVRRFNVAASRARDQMILFNSVTSDDLSASCLRRRLLAFFQNTEPQQVAGIERNELERRAARDNRGVVSPPSPFESWFEVDVALELLRRGFVVLAQYEVAGKRIDLVVEGGQARLAVECDGDYWHGADRYEEDMQRQRQLERCGWEFFRVRESAFYANKDDALTGLWRVLGDRGIFPNSPRPDTETKAGTVSIVHADTRATH